MLLGQISEIDVVFVKRVPAIRNGERFRDPEDIEDLRRSIAERAPCVGGGPLILYLEVPRAVCEMYFRVCIGATMRRKSVRCK